LSDRVAQNSGSISSGHGLVSGSIDSGAVGSVAVGSAAVGSGAVSGLVGIVAVGGLVGSGAVGLVDLNQISVFLAFVGVPNLGCCRVDYSESNVCVADWNDTYDSNTFRSRG